jgi:transcriptional regulator with XRE-family HTH domain
MTNKKVSTAERLREAMNSAGKKQADLVRETGLDRGAISSYLSGKYEPKQNAINKLAIALDVSEMWLWGYDTPKERSVEQKKNDILSDIVIKMRTDDKFMELVEMLYRLDDDKKAIVKSLLSAFSEADK